MYALLKNLDPVTKICKTVVPFQNGGQITDFYLNQNLKKKKKTPFPKEFVTEIGSK